MQKCMQAGLILCKLVGITQQYSVYFVQDNGCLQQQEPQKRIATPAGGQGPACLPAAVLQQSSALDSVSEDRLEHGHQVRQKTCGLIWIMKAAYQGFVSNRQCNLDTA